MKQRIVIKLLTTDEKGRSKAMKKVVGVRGVSAASIEGEKRNFLVIVGEGVDSVKLMSLLKKKIGSTELLSISPTREREWDAMDYGHEQPYGYMTTYIRPYTWGY